MTNRWLLIGIACALLAAAFLQGDHILNPSQEITGSSHSSPSSHTNSGTSATPSDPACKSSQGYRQISQKKVRSICVKVQFVEITSGTEELGFDWIEAPFEFGE